MSIDPIFYHGGGPIYDDDCTDEPKGWYFWDEVWVHYIGPYFTKEQAAKMLQEYAEAL